jgi:hypothetical protein
MPPPLRSWAGRWGFAIEGDAEEVGVGSGDVSGVGSGDASGDGSGDGEGDGDVGSGDGDGDAGGGDDEERDGEGRGELGRGELGRGEGDVDAAGRAPTWGEAAVLGTPAEGRVDEECFPGDGAAAEASVLGGCADWGDGPCLPAVGCNPFGASKCLSTRNPPTPTSATASVAAPAATTYVRRGRTARESARPG